MKKKKLTKAETDKIDTHSLGWYGIGWEMDPQKISIKNTVRLLKTLAAAAHMTWDHAMRTGRAPSEDVSPAEGLLLVAYTLDHLAKTAKVTSLKTSVLASYFQKKDPAMGKIYKTLQADLNKIVPGYSEVPEHGDE